jgi:hypothetical protein
MSRIFAAVVNDKGGAAKTLLHAELRERIEATDSTSWTYAEVEQRPWFSQDLYSWPDSKNAVRTIPLLQFNETKKKTELSIEPLNELLSIIPKDEGGANVLVDFGASAFQSFSLWLVEHRALSKLKAAKYRFVFFVPTVARDVDSTDWVNGNVPTLRSIGQVVLAKNLIKGSDFSAIDEQLRLELPTITLPYAGAPLTDEMCVGRRRLTFRQVTSANCSRRSRIDADTCARQLDEQFDRIIKPILFPESP